MNLGIFKKVIPFITSALPGGGIVSKIAIAAINNALGTNVKDADEAAIALAKATPDQILALKQEENNFKLKMEELGIKHVEELAALTVQDRDSARNREIYVRDKIPAILGIFTVVAFFAIVVLLNYHVFPPEARDVMMLLLGALTVCFKDVYGYYFGSSAGSAAKNQMIDKLSE